MISRTAAKNPRGETESSIRLYCKYFFVDGASFDGWPEFMANLSSYYGWFISGSLDKKHHNDKRFSYFFIFPLLALLGS